MNTRLTITQKKEIFGSWKFFDDSLLNNEVNDLANLSLAQVEEILTHATAYAELGNMNKDDDSLDIEQQRAWSGFEKSMLSLERKSEFIINQNKAKNDTKIAISNETGFITKDALDNPIGIGAGLGVDEIFLYYKKQWLCIHREQYLDFCYADPCFLGRGETPEEAHFDRMKRKANNDWADLTGRDPRLKN